MVDRGNPSINRWFGGTPILGNPQIGMQEDRIRVMRALSVEGWKIVPRVTGWLFHICSKKLAKVPSVWRAVNMLMVPVRPSPATITWIPSVRRRSAKPTAQRHAMAIKISGAWPRMPLVTSALHQNHHIGQSTWSIYMVNLHGQSTWSIYMAHFPCSSMKCRMFGDVPMGLGCCHLASLKNAIAIALWQWYPWLHGFVPSEFF